MQLVREGQSHHFRQEHSSLWLVAPRFPQLQGEYRKQETRCPHGFARSAWRIRAGNPERTWSACVATSQWRRPTVFRSTLVNISYTIGVLGRLDSDALKDKSL